MGIEGKQQGMQGETKPDQQSHFSQPDIKIFINFLVIYNKFQIYIIQDLVYNYAKLYNKQFIRHTPLRASFSFLVGFINSKLLNIPKIFRERFTDGSRL